MQSGQLVRDIRGEVFGLGLEMWLWSQLQAGAGDTDLDSGHIEVTADTVKRMIFRSGRVSGQRSRGLRPSVSKYSGQSQISESSQQENWRPAIGRWEEKSDDRGRRQFAMGAAQRVDTRPEDRASELPSRSRDPDRHEPVDPVTLQKALPPAYQTHPQSALSLIFM